MQAPADAGGAATYQFVFAGLPENVEYFVAAGPLVSPPLQGARGRPAVGKRDSCYLPYPKWTGMKPVTEEHFGDLRAIEGTDAAIEVEMDHPLKDGQLMLDGGQTIQLTGGQGNKYQGSSTWRRTALTMLPPRTRPAGAALGGLLHCYRQGAAASDFHRLAGRRLPRQPDRGSHGRREGCGSIWIERCASSLFGERGPDRDVSMLKAPGAKSARWFPHAAPGGLQAGAGRPGESSMQREGRPLEARHRHQFHPGRPFEREFSQSQQSGGGRRGRRK